MGHWYIIQTNPNCETKAVGEIRRAGFRAYLPKAAGIKMHHRTKLPLVKRRPALVGYVFVRFPDERPNWYELRQCQGVKGVLYSDGRPYQMPYKDIASIIRAQRKAEFDTGDARTYRLAKRLGERQSIMRSMAKAKFKPGARVRSSSGPLQHIIARVEEVTRTGSIVAILEMGGSKPGAIGQEVSIEFIDPERLELVDEHAEAA